MSLEDQHKKSETKLNRHAKNGNNSHAAACGRRWVVQSMIQVRVKIQVTGHTEECPGEGRSLFKVVCLVSHALEEPLSPTLLHCMCKLKLGICPRASLTTTCRAFKSGNLMPWRVFFMWANKKKLQGAKSEEYRGEEPVLCL